MVVWSRQNISLCDHSKFFCFTSTVPSLAFPCTPQGIHLRTHSPSFHCGYSSIGFSFRPWFYYNNHHSELGWRISHTTHLEIWEKQIVLKLMVRILPVKRPKLDLICCNSLLNWSTKLARFSPPIGEKAGTNRFFIVSSVFRASSRMKVFTSRSFWILTTIPSF